jgi:rhomboid-like protein
MEILQEIQYRRVTGSLSDKGIDFPDKPEFTQSHRDRALEWLRENYPVDEEAAAAEYAEEVAEELRKELEERAKRLRLYKSDDAEVEEAKEEEIIIDERYDETPLRADQTKDITGESALEARKQYVEASRKKAKIEAEKEAAEYEARGEKPPEPYKGHDLVVAKKTALGTLFPFILAIGLYCRQC